MDELQRVRSDIHALSNSIQRFIEEDVDNAIYRSPIIDWHHPTSYQQSSISGLRKFQQTVQNEKDYIDKLAQSPFPPSDIALATNVPHLLAVWDEVKYARWPINSVSQIIDVGSTQVKVDVVSGGGDEWVKVNTMKESRMMAEFREQDSYINSDYDSESDNSEEVNGSLAGPSRPSRPTLTNSAIEQASALYAAAQIYPRPTGMPKPKVKYVLNRLGENPEGGYSDPRVKETFAIIRAIGVDLVLASDQRSIPPKLRRPSFRPTRKILLDLSVVVALCCDSTHQPLPTSSKELEKRFRAYQISPNIGELELAPHSNVTKDLRDQLEWEMQHPLIQEMQERLSDVQNEGPIDFWVTKEVKSRLPAIADIIGGEDEKRRAKAMFSTEVEGDKRLDFWEGSRWQGRTGILQDMRVRVLEDENDVNVEDDDIMLEKTKMKLQNSPFHLGFISICQEMLEMIEHQASVATTPTPIPNLDSSNGDKKRRSKKKKSHQPHQTGISFSSRLPSSHTLRTFVAGFQRGWTVLTNNRGAVGKVIRELRVGEGIPYSHSQEEPEEDEEEGGELVEDAAVWVVNPSSLAEWRRREVEIRDEETLALFAERSNTVVRQTIDSSMKDAETELQS